MEQVDILFFSGLFPKNEETEIKEKMKSGMEDAQSALQWNIIDGLEANKCGKLTVLNRLPVNSYPRGYMDPFVKEFPFQHKCGELSDTNVGYCNITVIKQITMGTPFRSKIRKWVKDGETLKKVFLLYGAFGLSLELAKAVKRWNDQVETVCIIADLPEYSSIVKQSGLRKLFENYEVRKSRKLCCYIDKFVLLTDQMAQRLQLAAPYVVMEGIAPRSETYTDSISIPELKDRSYILYTGTLHYEFGIGTLLDAFGRIQNPDIRLVICGFGEAEKAILESQDKRIVYLGKVDRKQALALQQRATVLVNPRQNTEEFTKYSFPSKTMEYLASGVPVVAYKLDGIPDEYDPYLNYVPDNSVEALAETIQKIINMSAEDRKEIGRRGQKFVLEEKSAQKQTKRILDLINGIEMKTYR